MAVVTIPSSMAESSAATPRARSKRFRLNAFWEKWYPWLIGLALGGAITAIGPTAEQVFKALNASLSSAIDTAAILAGFQGTALGLLLSLLNTSPVKRLRKMRLFNRLVKYHWHSILAMGITVACFIALLAYQGTIQDFGSASRWVAGVVVFLAVSAALAAFRVTSLMVQILMLPKLDEPQLPQA